MSKLRLALASSLELPYRTSSLVRRIPGDMSAMEWVIEAQCSLGRAVAQLGELDVVVLSARYLIPGALKHDFLQQLGEEVRSHHGWHNRYTEDALGGWAGVVRRYSDQVWSDKLECSKSTLWRWRRAPLEAHRPGALTLADAWLKNALDNATISG